MKENRSLEENLIRGREGLIDKGLEMTVSECTGMGDNVFIYL